MRVFLVCTDNGGDDLGLVAIVIGERRTKRTVGEAARKDGGVGWAAFTAEERARDFAGRIGPLFNVDRKREEVDAVTNAFGGVGGGENAGASDLSNNGTLALLRKFAG